MLKSLFFKNFKFFIKDKIIYKNIIIIQTNFFIWQKIKQSELEKQK